MMAGWFSRRKIPHHKEAERSAAEAALKELFLLRAREQFIEALLIMDHARARGVEVSSEIIKSILALEQQISEKTISTDGYNAFLVASTKVAALIHPASAEGIRFVQTDESGYSRPRSIARRYSFAGLVIFLLLFLVQGYWFVLNGLLDTLKSTQEAIAPYSVLYEHTAASLKQDLSRPPTSEEVENKVDDLYSPGRRAKLNSLGILAQTSTNAPTAVINTGTTKTLSVDDFSQLKLQLISTINALKRFVGFASQILFSNDQLDETNPGSAAANLQKQYFFWAVDYDVIKNAQAAQMILELLNRYVLPILYGLLGSSIFLVRRINSDIRAASITVASRIDFGSRFFLGGVSGLAIAWFAVPKSSNPGTGNLVGYDTAILANLSPLVLSFVAGYAIELVFSFIDRIVAAFAVNSSGLNRNRIS